MRRGTSESVVNRGGADLHAAPEANQVAVYKAADRESSSMSNSYEMVRRFLDLLGTIAPEHYEDAKVNTYAALRDLKRDRDEARAALAEWERMRDQDHEMGQHWTPERGCGDNSCSFRTARGGMSTNGGCRCHENPQVAARVFRLLKGERNEARAEVERLRAAIRNHEKEMSNTGQVCRADRELWAALEADRG